MANRVVTFDGPERRTGFERRSVSPREQASGPRLVQAVDVGGVSFGPGKEKAFHEAVSAYNEKARAAHQPEIDLGVLEAKGFIRGFGGKAQEVLRSRNEQMTSPTDPTPAKLANPGHYAIPGGQPLDTMHPRAPAAGEPGYTTAGVQGALSAAQVEVGAGGGARTGGAGRTAKQVSSARGGGKKGR